MVLFQFERLVILIYEEFNTVFVLNPLTGNCFHLTIDETISILENNMKKRNKGNGK